MNPVAATSPVLGRTFLRPLPLPSPVPSVVEDDGVGIEQAVIDNLDKKIEENIGLKNVHQRLKLLYGEGLNITKLEQGTRIKFKILGGVKYD